MYTSMMDGFFCLRMRPSSMPLAVTRSTSRNASWYSSSPSRAIISPALVQILHSAGRCRAAKKGCTIFCTRWQNPRSSSQIKIFIHPVPLCPKARPGPRRAGILHLYYHKKYTILQGLSSRAGGAGPKKQPPPSWPESGGFGSVDGSPRLSQPGSSSLGSRFIRVSTASAALIPC